MCRRSSVGRRSVAGWSSGTRGFARHPWEFSALTGVHPMIETYPLHRVATLRGTCTGGRVPVSRSAVLDVMQVDA